jgi:hypothetical protein
MDILIKNRMGVFLAAFFLCSLHSPSEVHSAVGDRAPAFDLIDLAGKQHTYTEYEGEILLLFFIGHN